MKVGLVNVTGQLRGIQSRGSALARGAGAGSRDSTFGCRFPYLGVREGAGGRRAGASDARGLRRRAGLRDPRAGGFRSAMSGALLAAGAALGIAALRRRSPAPAAAGERPHHRRPGHRRPHQPARDRRRLGRQDGQAVLRRPAQPAGSSRRARAGSSSSASRSSPGAASAIRECHLVIRRAQISPAASPAWRTRRRSDRTIGLALVIARPWPRVGHCAFASTAARWSARRSCQLPFYDAAGRAPEDPAQRRRAHEHATCRAVRDTRGSARRGRASAARDRWRRAWLRELAPRSAARRQRLELRAAATCWLRRLATAEFLVEALAAGQHTRIERGCAIAPRSWAASPGLYPVLRQDAVLELAGTRANDLLVADLQREFRSLARTPRGRCGTLVLTSMIGVGVTGRLPRRARERRDVSRSGAIRVSVTISGSTLADIADRA